MDVFVGDQIELPNRRECEKQVRLFRDFSPDWHARTVGCLDGTYVPMWCTDEDDAFYRCRKGFTAYNVLMMTGANCRIFWITADRPGKTHLEFN